jgi:hypothetical protein
MLFLSRPYLLIGGSVFPVYILNSERNFSISIIEEISDRELRIESWLASLSPCRPARLRRGQRGQTRVGQIILLSNPS